MKFQKLIIHNIASIEDATIEFDKQPLSDSDVFLITGKTGSGKSTILDSICLALYATTPRFVNTLMQGTTEDGKQDIQISDPRQLMRRNTYEASVTLTFVGNNGVSYMAEWSVERAFKKVTGNLKAKKWSLTNLDRGIEITHDDKIKPEILAATGLDFNQFCRTTMLAQGEFTRFLNSIDNEKAAILEKITGVDIYSKIGVKIYNNKCQKENELAQAQMKVDGTKTFSEDEIKERKQRVSELESDVSGLIKSSEEDCSRRDWIVEEVKLGQSVTDELEKYNDAKERMNSPAVIEDEKLVDEWGKTSEARAWLREVEKAERMIDGFNSELTTLRGDFARILGGRKTVEKTVALIENKANAVDKFLKSEVANASIYENEQSIRGYLKTIIDGRRDIANYNKDIRKDIDDLVNVFTPIHKKAEDDYKNAKDEFEKEEHEVKKEEEFIVTLNLPELRSMRDSNKEMLNKIDAAKDKLGVLTNEKEKYENAGEKLKTRLASIKKHEGESDDMKTLIHDAEVEMNKCNEILGKQRDTIEKFTISLRQKLHVGDVCPVCRQEIKTEIPHEDELSLLVAGLQDEYDNSKSKYDNLLKEKISIDAQIKAEQASYDNDYKEYEEAKSVNIAKEKVLEACLACGIEAVDDNILDKLEQLRLTVKDTFDALDLKVSNGDDADAKVRARRKLLEEKRSAVNNLAKAESNAKTNVNECDGKIKSKQVLVETKIGDVAKAEHEVEKLIGDFKCDIDWKTSPVDFSSNLELLAKNYRHQVEQSTKLAGELMAVRKDIENVSQVIEMIITNMPEWNVVISSEDSSDQNLFSRANEVSAKVVSAQSNMKSANNSLSENKANLDSFFQENSNIDIERLRFLDGYSSGVIDEKMNTLKTYREDVISAMSRHNHAEEQLKEHLVKKPELSEEDSLERLSERIDGYSEKITELNVLKGAISQELLDDENKRNNLGQLIKERDQKNDEFQKWSRLNELFGDSKGNKFRKIAQSYILSSLIHSANGYMKSLTDRYTLKVTPGTFVIMLEDAYQGYVSRAASTISGGESFLVSLSLALALSDIGQRLSVDTLFIDEGFGTLSGEPLQNAITTLRSLHSTAGRHVGIISHVEELKERIPVQIQVNSEGNNSSKVEIRS